MSQTIQALMYHLQQINYGATQQVKSEMTQSQFVIEQTQHLLAKYKNFNANPEHFQFPNEAASYCLTLQGDVVIMRHHQNHSIPLKIVLPRGFPFHPPKVYINMGLSKAIAQQKTYIGNTNDIQIPYLQHWTNQGGPRGSSTLVELMDNISAVIHSDPPINEHGPTSSYGQPAAGYGQAVMQPMSSQPQYSQSQMYGQQPSYGVAQAMDNPYIGSASSAPPGMSVDSNQSKHIFVQEVNKKIDEYVLDYTQQATETCNRLIGSQAKMHDNQTQLQAKEEDLLKRISICESNIQSLNGQIESSNASIAQASSSEELTTDNIDNYIYAQNPLSEKMIYLVAKENALEDGLSAIKKCYEKEQIDIKTFMHQIRRTSGKQFKTTVKRNKLMAAMGVQQNNGY